MFKLLGNYKGLMVNTKLDNIRALCSIDMTLEALNEGRGVHSVVVFAWDSLDCCSLRAFNPHSLPKWLS
jgi:hypothetical protein